MYISRFQIGNYKSFSQPDPLTFTRGFNIVSGQNNAGKTALLEGLSLSLQAKGHRSLRVLPASDTVPDSRSWIEVSFTLPPGELKELIRASNLGVLRIAKPALDGEFARKIGFVDDSVSSVNRLLAAVFSEDPLTFTFRAEAQPGRPLNWTALQCPSCGLYAPQKPGGPHSGSVGWTTFMIEHDGRVRAIGQHAVDNNPTDFGGALAQAGVFQRHVYRFAAERMNVGRGPHGASTQLAPNAANLPEVLNQLQHNTSRFAALNRTLNNVLPQVRQVSVRAVNAGEVEIVVWPHDPETQREDLADPLAESGTGIGQVLAILYVVMTSSRPQVIIIDEPQSFLHPGAGRKLVEFLRTYPQHQFVVATHSPTIISAADPKTISLVRYEDGESTVQQLDASLERGIQATLAEVGVRLSDSFGADRILWVEGRTEEKCFRLIVEKVLERPLRGTEILGVRQTGDLASRDAKKIFEIYRRLGEGASLLPPAIAFLLDEECRDGDAKRELQSLSGGLVEFLPRRMYENYLLDPGAIASVMNGIEGFSPGAIAPERVEAAIQGKFKDGSFYCNRSHDARNVDGARILQEIFSELSETRVSYEKVQHGIALTEWLIENRPESLSELAGLLKTILDRAEGVGETIVQETNAARAVSKAV